MTPPYEPRPGTAACRVLAILRETGQRFGARQLSVELRIPWETAKDAVFHLAADGFVAKHGKWRAMVYSATGQVGRPSKLGHPPQKPAPEPAPLPPAVDACWPVVSHPTFSSLGPGRYLPNDNALRAAYPSEWGVL